jgi:hypothetical protein
VELNNWYQSSFLGQIREENFGSFCIFLKGEKGRQTSDSIMKHFLIEFSKKKDI